MAEPFIAEIRIFSFNFAPVPGWALCNGASLPVAQNQALYSLLGVQYGSTGTPQPTAFNLPDLQGRVPIHRNYGVNPPAGAGPTILPGAVGGVETVTLTAAQMPAHNHFLSASTVNATLNLPGYDGVAVYGTVVPDPSAQTSKAQNLYSNPTAGSVALAANTITSTGGGAAHSNIQPCLVLNFCIATLGLYPQRQ